ncbi:dTDP-4-keto-L-6-deoxy-hexose 2,3-reductase [Spirochaetia bacterium]|nr:dTDP-4-keto-L-6-deoxy-hexose 2,3-reductase [Spirochaetia bacterium]
MQKRAFGKTGLKITPLGFGTMEIRLVDEKTAGKVLNGVLDRGINYIDTSPEYPKAEIYIGSTIAKRRDEYVLATKCCDNMTGIGPMYTFDRQTVLDNVDESLRLMKTDHIDIMQIHGVIPEYLPGGPAGEVWETLREIKKAGKILHIGATICNKGPEFYGFPATYGYNSILRFAAWPEFEVIQLVYGCMTRLSEDVIQKAYDAYGTGIVARGALKQYTPVYDERFNVSRIAELFEPGETKDQFFIRYAMTHPGLANVMVGTKQLAHLEDNIKAAEKGPLSPEVYAEAKRRLNFVGVIPGPVDMKLDW